jgi:hypothetical protein
MTAIQDDSVELLAECVLLVTKNFNRMATENRSSEPDFPTDQLPSVTMPQFGKALEAVPFMLAKFFTSGSSMEAQNIGRYLRIISVSMAMAAAESFAPYRHCMRYQYDTLESNVVKALAGSSPIKDFGIEHSMVKSAFSPHARPKAKVSKDDYELQLAFRMFLYTTALWYGASSEEAERLMNQHLKARWMLIMCGNWKEALDGLKK